MPTRVILAGGNPVAVDAVALGIIRHFAHWEPVTTKGVWDQAQIQRAAALDLGARGPHEVELVADDLTGGDEAFRRLLADVRQHVGLG